MTTTAARTAALIAAILTTTAILLGATATTASAAPTAPITQVQEDDAAWDCNTMGNHTCGPQVDQVEDFPGGMSVTLDNGVVLTCRDWDTTGDECTSADTLQHYLHAFDAPQQEDRTVCYFIDIANPGDEPWLVLVSDYTEDGLCRQV